MHGQHRAPLLLVGTEAFIPLSLAIAALEPQDNLPGSASGASSPAFGGLARLSPPRSPRSPSRLAAGLEPPMSPGNPLRADGKRKPTDRPGARGVRYKYMALRPDSWIGGQLTMGIAPEYTTLKDVRSLCNCILEMSCTLLTHYCQATRSSIMNSADRSSPAVTVLHGLLSFLHEFHRQPSRAIDSDTVDYLLELDQAIRSGQQLGASSEVPSSGPGSSSLVQTVDVESWALGGPN